MSAYLIPNTTSFHVRFKFLEFVFLTKGARMFLNNHFQNHLKVLRLLFQRLNYIQYFENINTI